MYGDSYGGRSYTGTVDCAGETVDTWTVAANAGDTLYVSVDTVAADTAFDPIFYVNGPDSCTLVKGDDGFNCTFDPATPYGCPNATVPTDVAGDYQIVIWSWSGGCTGTQADYKLQLHF
jgi:hypothetical protein